MGVFTGVPGADLATVMKLDIAVQLSSVLLNGQTADSVNGFEAFVKSEASDSSKERVYTILDQGATAPHKLRTRNPDPEDCQHTL